MFDDLEHVANGFLETDEQALMTTWWLFRKT